MRLEGDFGAAPDGYGGEWPPFRTFGDLYYTYQVSLDLKVEEGLAIRTEPHPRFYTDPTNTTPIAVPALIRRWWPILYFLVFKSPPEGATHIFRPGEPFVQILILPEEADLDLVPMSEEEAAERELQSRRIFESRSTLPPTSRRQDHVQGDRVGLGHEVRFSGKTRSRVLGSASGGTLTTQLAQIEIDGMGKAISPRGDMPKYRVPLFVCKDAPCLPSTASPPTNSLA